MRRFQVAALLMVPLWLVAAIAARADSLLLPARTLEPLPGQSSCLGLRIVDTDNGGLVHAFPALGCVTAVVHAGPRRAFVLVESDTYPFASPGSMEWFDLLHVDLDSGAVLARRRVDNPFLREVLWLRAIDDGEILVGIDVAIDTPKTRLLRAGLVDGQWTLRADETVDGQVDLSDAGDLVPAWHEAAGTATVDLYRIGDLAPVRSFPMALQDPDSDFVVSIDAHAGVVYAWTGGRVTRVQSFDADTGTALAAPTWFAANAVPKFFAHDARGRLLFPFYRTVADLDPRQAPHSLQNLSAVDLATLATTPLLVDDESELVIQALASVGDRVVVLQSGQFTCFESGCIPSQPLRIGVVAGTRVSVQPSETVLSTPRSLQFAVASLGPGVVAGPTSAQGGIPTVTFAGCLVLAGALIVLARLATRNPAPRRKPG